MIVYVRKKLIKLKAKNMIRFFFVVLLLHIKLNRKESILEIDNKLKLH